MRLPSPLVNAACLVLLLSGCATPGENVVFVTKTSIGINVESTPPSASFANDRLEGFFAPKYSDGTIPPVISSLSTNGELFNREIKQLYATGNAAIIATSETTPAIPATGNLSIVGDANEVKQMFFGTSTTIGIKLGFGATVVDAFTLGYRRGEISIIPLGKPGTPFPSVLSTLDTNLAAKTLQNTQQGIGQVFATGTAAEQMAGRPNVRETFKNATTLLTEYRSGERLQNITIIDILNCLSQVSDDKLEKIWQNANGLKLIDDNTITKIQSATSTQIARSAYTKKIAIATDASSEKHSGLLIGHKVFVCDLRKP